MTHLRNVFMLSVVTLSLALPTALTTGCNKNGNVPEAPKPRRPKEVAADAPTAPRQQDCPKIQGKQPSSVPYHDRSIAESNHLAASGLTQLKSSRSQKLPPAEREDLFTQAVKQFITALRADPYNVHATYNLAAAYARIKRHQCSLNLLTRLVLLRRLHSQASLVEKKIDRLLGRGTNSMDPDFRRLRDDQQFRALVKKLDPSR